MWTPPSWLNILCTCRHCVFEICRNRLILRQLIQNNTSLQNTRYLRLTSVCGSSGREYNSGCQDKQSQRSNVWYSNEISYTFKYPQALRAKVNKGNLILSAKYKHNPYMHIGNWKQAESEKMGSYSETWQQHTKSSVQQFQARSIGHEAFSLTIRWLVALKTTTENSSHTNRCWIWRGVGIIRVCPMVCISTKSVLHCRKTRTLHRILIARSRTSTRSIVCLSSRHVSSTVICLNTKQNTSSVVTVNQQVDKK